MTITRVAANCKAGTAGNGATSASVSTSVDLTIGSLVNIKVFRYQNPVNQAIAVGNLAQTAGTATIGTITLDKELTFNSNGSTYLSVAIFSFVVLSGGSATFTVSGQPSSSYFWPILEEHTGNWDATAANRLVTTAQATGASGGPSSGNMTGDSAGGLFTGVMMTNASGSGITTTQDPAWTLTFEDEDPSGIANGAAITRIATGALTAAANWSAPTAYAWAAIGAVYKETSGGGGTIVNPLSGIGGAAANPLAA